MAYDADVTAPVGQKGARGPIHQTSVVQETEIDPAVAADEFSIPAPLFCTLSLLEAELSTLGSATTIQPEFGTTSQFNLDEIGDGGKAASPAVYHRLETPFRLYCPERKIFFRSKPDVDTDAAGVVDWRITLYEGHGS